MQTEWVYKTPSLPQGVLVGCDAEQEWILPWWWKHYSAINSIPVLFIDFGMSPEAADWCAQRGTVALVHVAIEVPRREEIDPSLVSKWEEAHGTNFWKSRPTWFKKPFALLQTPFEKTLWLDLDCEVKADLKPLFSGFTEELSLVQEPEFAQDKMRAFTLCAPDEKIYNSGVVLYRHGSPAIKAWAEESTFRNQFFIGDQNLLSRILYEKKIEVTELSKLYNWRMSLGENEGAIIHHWVSEYGKMKIFMSLHNLR